MAPETEPIKETIPCTLDRPRQLRLTFRDLAALARDLPGQNPLTLIDSLLTRVEDAAGVMQVQCTNLWALQVLLWAALRWEEPALTLDQVADLITAHVQSRRGNLADVAALVYAAWFVGGLRPASDEEKNAVAEAMTQH